MNIVCTVALLIMHALPLEFPAPRSHCGKSIYLLISPHVIKHWRREQPGNKARCGGGEERRMSDTS